MKPTVYTRFVRGMRLYFGFVIIFVLVINIPFGSQSVLQSQGPLLWAALTTALVLASGGLLVLFPLRRRLKRALEADPRLACPWCTFDLSKSGPEGRCPECAATYEHSAVRNYWEGIDALFARAKRIAIFASDRAVLRASGLARTDSGDQP